MHVRRTTRVSRTSADDSLPHSSGHESWNSYCFFLLLSLMFPPRRSSSMLQNSPPRLSPLSTVTSYKLSYVISAVVTERRGELGFLVAAAAPPWGLPSVSRRWKHWCVPFIFVSEVCTCVCLCVCCVVLCECVWCILLIDVLTGQMSSNLSEAEEEEEEEAAGSDLWRAQKLQMSETQNSSLLLPLFFLLLRFYTWAHRDVMEIEIESFHSGKNLYLRTPNKYLP